MKSQPQEASLIPDPRSGQHDFLEVQEGLFQATPVGQVDPHHPHLLGHEDTVGAIPSMDHGHRVPQPIGHLGQAELQAAPTVPGYHTQAATEMVIPQDVREAIVLVRKVEEVAEVGAVFLMGLPEATVTGQQGDGRVTVRVEGGAVVGAEARQVPEGCLRVLSVVEVGRIRRALLEETASSVPHCQTGPHGAGPSIFCCHCSSFSFANPHPRICLLTFRDIGREREISM